jgi:hypothetical protein
MDAHGQVVADAHGNRPLKPTGYHSVTPRMSVDDVGRSSAGERDWFAAFLYVSVDDADQAYHRALVAGAVSLEEPFDLPHGNRQATVRDPFGNVIQIAASRFASPSNIA